MIDFIINRVMIVVERFWNVCLRLAKMGEYVLNKSTATSVSVTQSYGQVRILLISVLK